MHKSIPTDLGINGNTSLAVCSEIHEREFGEAIKPLTYFENGPITLNEDGTESKYPLENPTDMQKQETKRLWALNNMAMAQNRVKHAYINRWLLSLPRAVLLKELADRGVILSTWEKRSMKLEELQLLWVPTEEDLR